MICPLLLTCLAAAPQEPSTLEGIWAGGYRQPDETVSVELRITRSDVGLEGTVSLPERGFRMPASVERDGDDVTWTVVNDDGDVQARFRGALDGGALRGRVDGPAIVEAKCELLRIVPLDADDRARYAGSYRVDEATTLRIVRVPRSNDEVLGLDFPSAGIRAVLFPVSRVELVAGQGELPLPIQVRLVFQLDEAKNVERVEIELGDLSLVATPDGGKAAEPVTALRRPQPIWSPSDET